MEGNGNVGINIDEKGVVTGATGRLKVVEIEGVAQADLEKLLETQRGSHNQT